MKIRIELTDNSEEEIIIRTSAVTDETLRLQRVFADTLKSASEFEVSLGQTDYFIRLDSILFFESDTDRTALHTSDAMYQCKKRLRELAELLPSYFVRISKSAIVNSMKICAVEKNLTGASAISFAGSKKRVYVSRMYYASLKETIRENRKI
ncbi:MAG TPA: LytTR family DNA-binding domain-containing protein [Bacillota bacterium]|nr:LytTR family DNA-binding domain-containing protein [Bacillota bacterium]